VGEYGFLALLIALSTIWGGFWWWVLGRIAESKALAEDQLLRRIFRGFGLFFGIGSPVGAVLGTALFLYF
jgi:hypothetical protein